jgi:hypothetical protein
LRYFEEQVVTFPNSKQVIQSWIVAAGDLFDSVIIHVELSISELPAVQQSTLFTEIDEKTMEHQRTTKSNIIDAALKELGDTTLQICNIPSKEELISAKRESPLDWDPVSNFHHNRIQPETSYREQKIAIKFVTDAIKKYTEVYNKFVKCSGIRGSGKTWTMEYCVIYALCQGLNVITTSQMARRSIQLGGKHISFFLVFPLMTI